jgi:hypothetical protein
MQYLLLIYENEAPGKTVDRSKMHEEYGKFTKSIIASGNFKGGDALQPTSTATTVRHKDGKPVVTHGPFAETREALIGYYMIDAKDLDQALEIAGRVPSVQIGSIEVRRRANWQPRRSAAISVPPATGETLENVPHSPCRSSEVSVQLLATPAARRSSDGRTDDRRL